MSEIYILKQKKKKTHTQEVFFFQTLKIISAQNHFNLSIM